MLEIEDLTISQQEAIKKLRERIENEFSPQLREDETVFYRFLKARDFNLKAAENMLRKHLVDRKTYGLDTILTDYEVPQYLNEYFPVSFVGFDKEGFVVRYVDIGGADPKGILNTWTVDQVIQYNGYYYEQDTLKLREQSRKLGRSITKVTMILNMEGLNLAKVTFKKGVEALIKGFTLFQDNYPERIKSIYIINTQFYFNIAFSIIKPCLASSLVQKIRIYGKDGWKDDLLAAIDADVLPAFLGGNRTDPDGNPLCNTFIFHGKKVPEELYNKKLQKSLSKEDNVKKLIVLPFSCSEIKVNVSEPNSQIVWEFETKSRDIGFALYYKDNSIANPGTVELIPKQRFDTEFGSQTGVYKCEKVGTYTIMFDNSYSWIHSKEIYYRINLTKSKIDSPTTEF